MVVAFLFFILSASFEAVMDHLQFRYTKTNYFWNPKLSWMNKWKYTSIDRTITRTEKFFLSSTVFVFLTDGWHLMKWCRNRCIDVMIFIMVLDTTNWKMAIGVTLLVRALNSGLFEIIFKKLR